MSDGGFFGPDRLYYFWLLKRYKTNQKVDGKIGFWLYRKEMKELQKRHVTRTRQ
jgi:hypothetical protein